MKYFSFLLLIVSCTILIFYGCDSGTDSKPVSVTPPELVSPADRDTAVSRTPTFTWTGSADKLEIASNNTFTTIIYSSAVTGTSFTMPTALQPQTTYYWHAGNSASGTTYWSTNTFSFRTRN